MHAPNWKRTLPTRTLGTVLGLIATLALGGREARGQLAGLVDPLAQSDMLYLAGQPELAHDLLEEHIASDTADYEALWRLARARVVIGLEVEGNRLQNTWLDLALQHADRAVSLRPGAVDAIYWRGVSAGRRAMNASPGYAAELAQIVYDDAHAILAADSLHGGAHNMLGKLNYEIMSLSRIKRAIARTFMGNDALSDTSWENAELYLTKAAEVWPDFVVFHFDLAQLHRKRGREEEAVASYRRALSLPAVHPTDRRLQRQAAEILTEWDVPLEATGATKAVVAGATAAADTIGRE